MFKLLSALTVALPSVIYLALMMLVFNIEADIKVNANVGDIEIIVDNEIYLSTMVANQNDKEVEPLYLKAKNGSIIKTSDGYFYLEKATNNDATTWQLSKVNRQILTEKSGYQLPIGLTIGVIGILMAFSIVSGKMQWHLKYPKIATLLALLFATGVIWFLFTITSNLLGVFLVFTASWGAYCLEYTVYYFKNEEERHLSKAKYLERKLKEANKNV